MVNYPDDWSVVPLKDLGHIQMCRRIFQHQTTKLGSIPFYKIGTFGRKADAYITKELFEEYKSKYPYPSKSDVLISAAGTIGRVVIFDDYEAYFQDSNIVWLKINPKKIMNQFLYYFYVSFPWKGLEGTTIGRLYNNIILNTKIHLPLLDEQSRIAEALTSFDIYVESLSELIAKKKMIRDGAIEDLVNGKTRLSGFDEDWISGEIKDILQILHGKNQKSVESLSGKYPILGTGGVVGRTDEFLCDWECVLIGRKGTIDTPFYMDTPFWTIDTLYYSLPRKAQHPKFQYYLFLSIDWKKYAESSGRPSLTRKMIESIPVLIPEFEEQKAIAEILTAMDKEIQDLEEEKLKLEQIREGALDDLLTGRVRLKY